MSTDEILIRAKNISKKFSRDLQRSLLYGIQDLTRDLFGASLGNKALRKKEFYAVNDVSFEVKRGECLGLIGRNGAGKTTILKMLNGLIKPDEGRIEMRGRIGAMIALGAGFNPILTGRENIYIAGSVLGLTKKEIHDKVDDIIDFAEIGEFIDTPVQSYSSGMQVRLGFAVASALDPDILLLDEVLAVGDANFKLKCYRRVDELREKAAVIFVSHDIPSVARICDQTIVMSGGKINFFGDSQKASEIYFNMSFDSMKATNSFKQTFYPITDFEIEDIPENIAYHEKFTFKLKVVAEEDVDDFTFAIDVKNIGEGFAASNKTSSKQLGSKIRKGTNDFIVNISALPLRSGKYLMNFGLWNNGGGLIAFSKGMHEVHINGGYYGLPAECQLYIESWK